MQLGINCQPKAFGEFANSGRITNMPEQQPRPDYKQTLAVIVHALTAPSTTNVLHVLADALEQSVHRADIDHAAAARMLRGLANSRG